MGSTNIVNFMMECCFYGCWFKKIDSICNKKTLPETKVSGEWLKPQIIESLCSLHTAGFYVRAVITDNHSANLAAFSFLKEEFSPNNSDGDLFIFHPSEKISKIYLL